MSEELYALLKARDAELAALREYAEDLAEALRESEGRWGEEQGRERAADTLRRLRYEHGFKSDGRWRG